MSDDLFDEGLPEQRKPRPLLSIADFFDADDGVLRIPDWRLAQALGFSRNENVRNLIDRNKDTLLRFGPLLYGEVKSTGGRPSADCLLNFNQTIFIIIKSEAPNAIPVQIQVVEIYGLWATGRLLPADHETAVAVATATTKAYEQSPELVGMLQALLARIAELATQNDTSAIDERLASVQRTAIEIQARLSDIVKRRPAPVRNQDIYDRVVHDFYLDRCPCCMRPDRVILAKDGTRTRLYTLDHATDNPYKNALHEMWPVCSICNGKFKHDNRFRAEMADRFRVFQSHVQDIVGERFI